MATELSSSPLCFICHKPVQIESAAADEHGRSVHGECYFLKIIAAKPMPPNSPDARGQAKE
jgi:hypothetical protein